MARVITFSRTFPSYHPKAGRPTYFVEKIWESTKTFSEISLPGNVLFDEQYRYLRNPFVPKHHTIRAGHRWKVGDWFSPRVWSGKPYNSKQIQFAPEIQIKQIWDVEFDEDACLWIYSDKEKGAGVLHRVAKNDGLSLTDLMTWFNKPFTGQIICWNDKINY